MTDALIEKVARAMCSATPGPACVILDGCECRNEARAAILAVLDHFSEPSNVTDGMQFSASFRHLDDNGDWGDVIAAAMRAARDEVSRG